MWENSNIVIFLRQEIVNYVLNKLWPLLSQIINYITFAFCDLSRNKKFHLIAQINVVDDTWKCLNSDIFALIKMNLGSIS